MSIKFDWDHAGYLGGFAHGDKSYDHYINTKNDATYLIGEDQGVVFMVDSNATMYDQDKKVLGTFRIQNGNWVFLDKEGHEWDHKCGDDLLETERRMMRFLVK